LAEGVMYIYTCQLLLSKCQFPSPKHQGAWVWGKEILIFITQAAWYVVFS